MKKNISFLFLLLMPLMLFAGGTQEYGSENRFEYDIDNFSGIDGSASFEIEVKQGDRFSVVVYADSAVKSKLLVEKRGRSLYLGMKPFSGLIWNKSPKAVITMPSLDSVQLSGASSMIAAGFRDEKRFTADVSGASSLEIDVIASMASFELSGASDITAVLESEKINIDMSGSSDIELVGFGESLSADLGGASSGNLKDFHVTRASVELSGSSELHLNLDGELDLDASGASNLYYTGDIELGNIDLSGSSEMEPE